MAKYTFTYHSEEMGRKIIHEKDFSVIESVEENLEEVLDEFKLFLQAVTYNTAGLVNTISENDYYDVYDYAEELKRKTLDAEY